MQNHEDQQMISDSQPDQSSQNSEQNSGQNDQKQQQEELDIKKIFKDDKEEDCAQNEYNFKQNTKSLDKISVQPQIKKSGQKMSAKPAQKPTFLLNKVLQKSESKFQKFYQPLELSHLKSSFKSQNKIKKVNKPFYEQTFYITGMKQNYLLLLSDRNQVLEFPIGMFTSQNNNQLQNDEQINSQNHEQGHLLKDIKIGQPIKIKLQVDFFRQQKDEQMFKSLQKSIHQEYSEKEEQPQLKNKRNLQIEIVLGQIKKQT